ncbi:AraC family transcriptional regulator [Pseudomonas sp. GCM10022186]|uniref:helix-turn-helix transcriptional regulator n=1 Tax=Pseudomonas sp. GCM10022186 TaxID=3252650 RepID=UPI003613BEB0
MDTQIERKPLDRFAVIRTDDVEEMRVAATPFYGELYFSVADDYRDFRAHANHCQLNDMAISYVSFGSAVDQAYYPDISASYAVPIAIAGTGWGKTRGKKVSLAGRQGLIASPGERAELHSGPDFEEIAVLLDASVVERKLACLVGAEVNGGVIFDPAFDFENPVGRQWWRLLCFLIGEAEACEAGIPLTSLSEIEQALIVMFLKASRHSLSHLLNGQHRDVAPRTVRLAEEYIEAHWDQPITVERLAQLTSVSVRSLFHSFKKNRGYSPMGFVKQVRLRHARQMLLGGQPGTTVAAVAYKCGFGNLGNFAMDYRRAFGELPSSTVKSAWSSTTPTGQAAR